MYEQKEFDGIIYGRQTNYGKFWHFQSMPRIGQNENGMTEFGKQEGNAPIRCDCGNTAFELEYGDYEIIATCVKCGLEGSVYSG